MQRFRNLLMVYSDAANHRPAMAHVIALAGQTGAKLSFVDVLEDLHLDTSAVHAALPGDLLELRRDEIAHHIQALGADLDRVAIKILVGNAPVAIIQEVLRGGHDLVIKTAQGPDTGLGGRLFGSTAIKLMRKCPVPVWAFRPAPQIRFPRVLAAVGPPPEASVGDQLNAEIISLAAAFARAADGRLDVLHCWRLPGESLLTGGRTRVATSVLESMRDQAETRARDYLAKCMRHITLSGATSRSHLMRGRVGPILSRFIASEGIDLVVMGSLARTGISGLFAGSTAEHIFQTADCAVMAVKPPGFRSPVTLTTGS